MEKLKFHWNFYLPTLNFQILPTVLFEAALFEKNTLKKPLFEANSATSPPQKTDLNVQNAVIFFQLKHH